RILVHADAFPTNGCMSVPSWSRSNGRLFATVRLRACREKKKYRVAQNNHLKHPCPGLLIIAVGYGAWLRTSFGVLAGAALGGEDPMLVVQDGFAAWQESCGLEVDTR